MGINKNYSLIIISMIMLLLMPLTSSLIKPDLLTLDIEELNSQSVILRGELLSLGGYDSVNVSFEYRQENETDWNNTNLKQRSSIGKYEYRLINLDPNTYYEYRFKADYDSSSSYGVIRSFNTEPTQNIFSIDFTKDHNIIIFILFILLSLMLLYFKIYIFSALILIISGFILLSNGINIIISLILISIGVLIAFAGGND